MVGVAAEGLGHDLLELGFDLVDGLARREAGAVADAEDVGIDRERFLAERGVEDDIGGLAADAGKRLQFLARARNLAAVIVDQRPASAITFFALVLNRPIVLIASRRASSPKSTICWGFLMRVNSGRQAMLTLASVACADSTTATSN